MVYLFLYTANGLTAFLLAINIKWVVYLAIGKIEFISKKIAISILK